MHRRDFLIAAGALLLASGARAADLAAALAQASGRARFAPPDGAEMDAAEALFALILREAPDGQIAAAARAAGMRWRALDDRLTLLDELPSRRRGRGFYAFRRPMAGRPVLQMPHAFKDLRTREIGLAMFAGGDFDAAAWNTVPRRQSLDGRELESDLAHLPASWLSAFTRAIGAGHAARSVIQLHGFDSRRRGLALAAILSNGSRRPDPALRALATCLEEVVGRPVALFPEQVALLGGTRNAQLAALAGRQRFVHVEMDRALREALAGTPALLARFSGCLAGPAR